MQIYVSVTVTGCCINSQYPHSKVEHCASGPAGLADLSCGIRLTPLGVSDRQLFPCLLDKETKHLVLLLSSSLRRCTM